MKLILRSAVRPSANAFTLMEMMIVLAIIAMLIAVGAVTLKHIQDDAAIVAARAHLGTLKTAVTSYQTVTRKLPQSLDDLAKTGRLTEQGLTDPWGRRYQMKQPGTKSGGAFDLYSMGPKEGTPEDDVYHEP